MKKLFILLPIAFALPGCASIVGGTHQNVSVQTIPISGAQCQLSNDKGVFYIPVTPGTVMVNRSYSDMTVNCTKNQYTGSITVKSSTKAMAFGNIIAGGIIGGAVDMGTGAAYDYPSLIRVPMNRD